MPRPKKCRHVRCEINAYYFKPRGIPLVDLEEVVLSPDELEAIRLSDYEGLYQEAAAIEMRVSRSTFGRIVEEGRKKVADALIHGKALRIDALTTDEKQTLTETV